MTHEPFGWTPDPFETEFEGRSDGTMYLRPRRALGELPARLTDTLEYWAREAPQRTLIARRAPDGTWIHVTYRSMLERVERIAKVLAGRELSAERPIAILSGNSIEHLTLALAAMWVGIPYCPVSPSYAQASADFNKLRYVMSLLTPGMVAAFETPAFEAALRAVVPSDVEIIGDASVAGRDIVSLARLEDANSSRAARAHASTGPDTIAKFLLTSGSTGNPKAVITTHRMLCANAVMLRQALPFLQDEPPVLVDWLPWNHTFGGTHNVGLVLFYGGSLYIDDGKPTPTGMPETLRNLTEISPTVYFNVPKGFNVVKLAPVGDKLEVRARGPNVTPGYWREPHLTQAAFDQEGFYRLGDAVRLVDPADPRRGLRFDGRIAEDFKLASGTWVSVGPLRAELLTAFAPFLQDVVIAGLDRDYVAAVLIPDVAACASALKLPTADHSELARNPQLLRLLQERLDEHAARHPASSRCIRRAMLIPSRPSLDHGEITDKGSINQRAVLQHRSELVKQLYGESLSEGVIEVKLPMMRRLEHGDRQGASDCA